MVDQLEIWQHNVLTEARYEMSEVEKNILYMVVASIRKDDPPTRLYQVSVAELARLTGSDELNYKAYRQATRKLITRVVEVMQPNRDFLQMSFIASAEYKSGQGIIELELSQKIRPYYVELTKQFTKLQLQAAISLKSGYAKRVYELLCMHKNMKNTTFRRDLRELKMMMGIIDPTTGKDSYPDWSKFRLNVMDIADKEINGHTEVEFTYKPIYGDKAGRGRKPVEKVEFTVSYRASPVVEQQTSPLYERLQKRFKLRPDQAQEVLARYTLQHIHQQLHTIEQNQGTIRNVGAYTAKAFALKSTKKGQQQ